MPRPKKVTLSPEQDFNLRRKSRIAALLAHGYNVDDLWNMLSNPVMNGKQNPYFMPHPTTGQGVTKKVIERDIKDIHRDYHVKIATNQEYWENQTVMRLDAIYKQAFAKGEYNTAMAALDRIGRLVGLGEQKTEINIGIKGGSEVNALKENLMQRLGGMINKPPAELLQVNPTRPRMDEEVVEDTRNADTSDL